MQATRKTVDCLLIEGYRLTTAGTALRTLGKNPAFPPLSKIFNGKSPLRTEYIRKSRSQTSPNKGERFAENRALKTQLVAVQDPIRPRPTYPRLGPLTHTKSTTFLAFSKLASEPLRKEQWHAAVV